MDMCWQEMSEEYRRQAADLIGMIDSGERRIFEHGGEDPDFCRFVCNKLLLTGQGFGVISAARYRDCLHVSIAFSDDLPVAAEAAVIEQLTNLIKDTELNASVWCRNENGNLRKIIESTFQTELQDAACEMCLSKPEFDAWKAPVLPSEAELRGFDAERHGQYIDLLERGMRHVLHPGATPYLNGCGGLKLRFAALQKENRFHALWLGSQLAGLCYSDGDEIDTLVVEEKHRGKGAGYILLYSALANAFARQAGEMRLYVVDGNAGAFGFYRHCGMRVSGHSAHYVLDRRCLACGAL